MLKSYLVIAFKHLTTQKLYSAINIVGLAVGLACFILIALFVRHELSYDKFHSKAGRVFRISSDLTQPDGGTYRLAGTPPAMAPLLRQDFSQIEQTARVSKCAQGTLVSNGDRSFLETDFTAADGALLTMIDLEWLYGEPAGALDEPFSVVLTESTARKYFGEGNVVGETLVIENEYPVEITGVVADLPDNTHLAFDLLVSMGFVAAVNGADYLQAWNMNCYYTYVLLEQDASSGPIQTGLAAFVERHVPTNTGAARHFTVVSLPEIHFSGYQFDMRPPGSTAAVYAASAIAAFILLIACINFMNLSTARATQRAKEVGVRKAVGAGRGRLVAQYLGESVLLAAIAMMLALAIVELLLPAFGSFVRKDLSLDYFTSTWTPVLLGLLVLLVGLAAGSYPAFYLSAFSAASVLRGDVTRGTAAARFRKALVTVQFSISIALVIAAALVYEQIRFARNLELGYEKEQVVVATASLTDGLTGRWDALKREWLTHPEMIEATRSFQTPGSELQIFSGVRVEGGSPDVRGVGTVLVDYDFFATYDMNILAGRGFSADFAGDRIPGPASDAANARPGVVLNASAAREYGWTPEEAVGKWIDLGMGPNLLRGAIVGVVADVYFEPLRIPIRPMLYVLSSEVFLNRAAMPFVSIRITGRNLESTLEHIDEAWARLVPDQPMTRRFLDADFQALYDAEQREGLMLTFFSMLAIFVACLGLLGLASFTTEQRTKEIGVRKVMGATVLDIVRLFTGEFSRLVLLANLIAWPAAYFLMERWLANFAYRIDMSVLVFAGSALFAFVVALLTVGLVSARAASVNPAYSLRYE
jgi:putative ABC transport system permease protein